MRYFAFLSFFAVIAVSGCQSDGRGRGGAESAGGVALSIYNTGAERLPSGEAVDVMIYFPSWQYIGILEPQVSDGPFLHYMGRAEAEKILAELPVKRGIAAVIIDFYHPKDDRQRQQAEWISLLKKLGYRRVVFVKKEPEEPLAKARVIRDEVLR